MLRVVRKHFRGAIGPVSRKKRAPTEYPVEPERRRTYDSERQSDRARVRRRSGSS
jgi:hypothetical protein